MILSFNGFTPKIHETVFIAGNATVIGDVTIGERSSVWFNTVVRGDIHRISIGSRTNIQDNSVIHVTRNRFPATIGDDVTAGHRVILHGCEIRDRCLIGMGSIIMDGTVIEEDVIIGAGSLVTEGMKIPAGTLCFGSPAKVRRNLTPEEKEFIKFSAEHYVGDAKRYLGRSGDSHHNSPVNPEIR